jgi:hypothetical protein
MSPSSENSQTLSPLGPAANRVPAEKTAIFSCPSCSKITGLGMMPASVWNDQTGRPVALS